MVKDYLKFPISQKAFYNLNFDVILEYFFFDLFISLFSRQKGPEVVQADLLHTMGKNIQGTKPFILKNNVYQLRILTGNLGKSHSVIISYFNIYSLKYVRDNI